MRTGQHYEQIYSPTASCNSIRTLLVLSAVNDWHTKQLDFVLAFPQAPTACDLHVKMPKGFKTEDSNNDDCVLHLHTNVYGQKNAGHVWNKHLTHILVHKLKFEQSKS